MSDNTVSGWRIVSLGLAANNKELGSTKLSVIPIEQTPYLDGELASLPFDTEMAGDDGAGNAYNVKVTTDQAIEAEWLPKSSNRATPEDIRRNQRVLLWKYADRNEYHWQYLGLDDHLFKLETVVYRISATADVDVDSTAPENSYVLELSSHKKLITLQTSQANGEYCVYALQFNLAEGRVVLTDELGNNITLDSRNTLISLENAEGTLWQLDKQKLYGYAKDSMALKAENSVLFETKDYTLNADTVTVKSSTNTFNSPTTKFNGNVNVSGTVGVGGAFTGGGSATFEAGCVFKGAVQFQQPIIANGITSAGTIRGPSGSI